MKSPLIISVSALALLTLSATLFAQTATGSSLITQMKAATHSFTLSGDLNSGATDLESSPLVGKKTGDMLSAEEYNRILELVGQGGGGGSDGGFTTTLFDDITDGLANGGVKTYTCPQNQYVLSVTSIMVPSGQYSCANSPNADKKSVSYNSCAALTGQRWHTHVICGGGGATGGGGAGWVDVPVTDTADYDIACLYRIETSGASGVKIRYSVGMSTRNATFGWNIITGWIGGTVTATDKTHFSVTGYTPAQNNEYNVLKMEKLCGGGSSVGSTAPAASGSQVTRISRPWGWKGTSSFLQNVSDSSDWEVRTAAWDERCIADGYTGGGWIIDKDATGQVGFCTK